MAAMHRRIKSNKLDMVFSRLQVLAAWFRKSQAHGLIGSDVNSEDVSWKQGWGSDEPRLHETKSVKLEPESIPHHHRLVFYVKELEFAKQ